MVWTKLRFHVQVTVILKSDAHNFLKMFEPFQKNWAPEQWREASYILKN